jgi:hypothetical protein
MPVHDDNSRYTIKSTGGYAQDAGLKLADVEASLTEIVERRDKEALVRRMLTSEPALRKQLTKAGYGLKKTPARSKDRELYGVGYMVFDRSTNTVVLGATHHPCDASLEDVVEFAASEAA